MLHQSRLVASRLSELERAQRERLRRAEAKMGKEVESLGPEASRTAAEMERVRADASAAVERCAAAVLAAAERQQPCW
eukprot:5213863-Pleurochrysis_carterae.AAC.1